MMPRKKKRTSPSLSGRDTFHVVGPAGDLAVKGAAAHALVAAQERAQRNYADTVELIVERRSLFGPAAKLYRVERTESGDVLTYTIESVD